MRFEDLRTRPNQIGTTIALSAVRSRMREYNRAVCFITNAVAACADSAGGSCVPSFAISSTVQFPALAVGAAEELVGVRIVGGHAAAVVFDLLAGPVGDQAQQHHLDHVAGV